MAPTVTDLDRDEVAKLIVSLHDEATQFFSELDGGRALREDAWERPGGGGGVTRVLTDGHVFEKCGVNRSVVEGVMPAQMAQRLGARRRQPPRRLARRRYRPHADVPLPG